MINTTKTKYLLAGDSDHLESSVLVDGGNLEIVKEFCYLGTVVTSDNDINSEIRRRIVQVNRTYYGLYRPLRSSSLRDRTRCEISISYIDSPGGPLWTRGPFERRMQTLWACLSDLRIV